METSILCQKNKLLQVYNIILMGKNITMQYKQKMQHDIVSVIALSRL